MSINTVSGASPPLTFADPHQSMTWRTSLSLVLVFPFCLLSATAWWAGCRKPRRRGRGSASWSWGACDEDVSGHHNSMMGTWVPLALSSCLSWCSFYCSVRRRGRWPGGRGWGWHSGRGSQGGQGGWTGGAGDPLLLGGHCSPESPSILNNDYLGFLREFIALHQHLLVKELSVWKISTNLCSRMYRSNFDNS